MTSILLALALFSGCAAYAVRGRVVEGLQPAVLFVPPDDPSIAAGRGVAGAEILIYRDPDRLNRSLVARTVSDANGEFTLPIDAFGAGWMEEVWEIEGRARGYIHAETITTLPPAGDGQALLILLPPG